MAPWNDNSFIDRTALYVWNTQGASSNAPTGADIRFWKLFYIDSCHPCMTGSVATGSVYVCVDDQAVVYLNTVQVLFINSPGYGSSCVGYSSSFQIAAGSNQFAFYARNNNGAAGLLFAIYCQAGSSSLLLMHSDASWSTEQQSYKANVNSVSYCPIGVTFEINVNLPNPPSKIEKYLHR